ncbi:MAG: hypothetical protein JW395_0786 [Nitrospira sp.]|nr:hypothetical protein [Nitrospira sp.]
MHTSRKSIGIIMLVLLTTILTGCVRVDRALSVNNDGTGSYTLTLGVKEPTAGDPSSVAPSIVTPLEVFAAKVQQTGGSYKRFQSDGYAYWSFERPFSSIEEANGFLQEDPRQYDANNSPVLFKDDLRIVEDSSLASLLMKRYRVTGSISLADPFKMAPNWTDASETVTITMPGGIGAASGGAREGNSVTYAIRYNESAPIDVSTPASVPSMSVPVVAVPATVLALIGLTIALLWPKWRGAHHAAGA